ncbi:MAG TPA: nucleotidyltransferase family protein [Candidatus Pelagibacter sp.]|nr:nucleotidyltransferase family protein [Candidatus Pelagibacter sp.]
MISSILLAAGESKRMKGENKLTKTIKDIPLIKYTIKNILGSAVDEIIVVLGHEKEELKTIIEKNKKIKLVFNENFKSGIASSIKVGLKNISNKTDAFFICLGDMPVVNQNIYNKLIKARNSYNKKLKPIFKREIIIPSYEGQDGNPILFSKFMKKKLMNLKEDLGPKEIIELNKKKILNIPFDNEGILVDFDTQENFKNL